MADFLPCRESQQHSQRTAEHLVPRKGWDSQHQGSQLPWSLCRHHWSYESTCMRSCPYCPFSICMKALIKWFEEKSISNSLLRCSHPAYRGLSVKITISKSYYIQRCFRKPWNAIWKTLFPARVATEWTQKMESTFWWFRVVEDEDFSFAQVLAMHSSPCLSHRQPVKYMKHFILKILCLGHF